MDTVRWGLLSTANINKKVIPAIRASSRGTLTAVASRSPERARAYADQWSIPLSYGSYQEMLDSGKVDAVYISLPNHLHAPWSIQALKAGLHVLCEKPLAVSLEDVDSLIKTSRETGFHLAEAFMYRHHPQTKFVGEWVRSGKLGSISLIRGAFDFQLGKKQRQPENLNVRLEPEFGGGCLWDVGVYPLSFSQYLMGSPPTGVFGSQRLGETGVDEVFAGQMGYENNTGKETFAQISASFQNPFHTFLAVVGSEGRLYLNRPFTNMEDESQLIFTSREGKVRDVPLPRKDLYLGEIEDMNAVVLDGVEPYLSLQESRQHIQTALALYQSARTGQLVRL